MDLDAWLISALKPRTRASAFPINRVTCRQQQQRLTRGVTVSTSPESRRTSASGARREARRPEPATRKRRASRAKKNTEGFPFEQIPIRKQESSLNIIEVPYVLTDHESVDEGQMEEVCGPDSDSRHLLGVLCKDPMLGREACGATPEVVVPEGTTLTKGKKENKVEGGEDEETIKFTGISASEQRRRLEFEASLRRG
ncbi:hypothetical protein GWK47_030802 [Chionoecetes opilio]|uniref:Uncharacterized protein n=1 Tax=Chionoecetes opilio TaxID=41210 RepID=A0A8J4YLA7_CHIOP|nr:hypothetical protein GWK47_030802 [Chionoecetes opilio]